MSTRTFLFCDLCNPQGVRTIERRSKNRADNSGRRISDGRMWFEGSIEQAVSESGWAVSNNGNHVCASCYDKGLEQ